MSKFKIKTTHRMTKYIKKLLPECKVDLVKISMNKFQYLVDFHLGEHEQDLDYNTLSYWVIRVVYPAEYYACPKYLTTKDLVYCFLQSDRSFESFMDELKAFCGI